MMSDEDTNTMDDVTNSVINVDAPTCDATSTNNVNDTTPGTKRKSDDDSKKKKQKQRVDSGLIAMDRALMTQPIMTRTLPISLLELMNENPVNVNRRARIDLQLLRVIGNSVVSNSRAHIYGAFARNRNQSSDVNYSRLFLCKVVSMNEGNSLVYMMESRNTNKLLWSRNPQFRDDGILTIGAIFTVLSPNPITNLMSNDIPMLETRFPVVVMRPPKLHIETRVVLDVAGNSSKAFVSIAALLISNLQRLKKQIVQVSFVINKESTKLRHEVIKDVVVILC
jgi:hypothetical protein